MMHVSHEAVAFVKSDEGSIYVVAFGGGHILHAAGPITEDEARSLLHARNGFDSDRDIARVLDARWYVDAGAVDVAEQRAKRDLRVW